MKTNILAGILVLASISPTAPSKAIEKRNPKGPFSLIAYGVAPSYIKIFYSDGRHFPSLTLSIKHLTDV